MDLDGICGPFRARRIRQLGGADPTTLSAWPEPRAFLRARALVRRALLSQMALMRCLPLIPLGCWHLHTMLVRVLARVCMVAGRLMTHPNLCSFLQA